jgi:hypothetical protein
MVIHHIFSVLLIGWPLVAGKYANEMHFTLSQGELTAPLLNIHEILETLDEKPQLRKKLMMAFLGLFVFLRCTLSYWTMGKIQRNPDTDVVYKSLPTLLWFLSMDWVWAMLNKGSKLMSQVRG